MQRAVGNADEYFVEIDYCDPVGDTADWTTTHAAVVQAVASPDDDDDDDDDDASLLAVEETSEIETENVGGGIDGPVAKVQGEMDEIGANETRMAEKAT